MSRKLSSFQPARRSQNLVSQLGRGQGAPQGAFAEYWMSVIGGRAENICSFRVILSLTRNGKWSFHLVSFGEYHRRNTFSAETSCYLARSNAYSRDDSPPKYQSVDNVWSIMPLTVDDDGTVGGRAELNSRAARYRKLARGMIDIATSEKILAFAAELECEAHDSTRP
jgi:hypothetical protein